MTGSRLLGTVMALAATGLVVAGLVVGVGGAREPRPTTAAAAGNGTGTVTDAGVPGAPVAELPPAVPARGRDARRPGAPSRLLVPSLGIDAPVDPVGLRGTTLTPPADARRLGWWAGSTPAGSGRGATVLAGHTVRAGGGALDDLETLRRGAVAWITTSRGRLPYVVTSVQVLDKGALARRAVRLFDAAGRPRLVLITCEDWDGTRYRSNVVVIATPRRRALG